MTIDPAFAGPPDHGRMQAGRLKALPVGDRVRSSLPKGHSRQAKDTKQINKNNSFDWFIQNINTIALVEGI